MKNSGLVSVIMPAYNAAGTIEEAINSVRHQIYQNWELVIVNDASVDDTQNIISRLMKIDTRIKTVVLERNAGLPNARNVAVNHSTGDWLAFLDSDDYWFPEKLEKQMLFHSRNDKILVSHTNFSTFTDRITDLKKLGVLSGFLDKKDGDLLKQLLWKNSIAVLTVIMHREVFNSSGPFNVNLKTFEDIDLWIRIALRKYKFGYINENLAAYRINPGGISRTLGKYKKAHKIFLILYDSLLKNKGVYRKAKGNYYRYFGIEYYKQKKYKLAGLYFERSISFFGFNYLNILNLIYLLSLKRKKNNND